MRLLNTLPLFALLSAPVFAQGDLFTKAPPEIDEPLRERVAAFYQAHTDGKFREAEKYVAPGESQEFFYQMEKKRYDKCKTIRISYEKDFNEAIVTESCRGKWTIQGQTLDSEMAMTSSWKRVEGAWFWHLKQLDRVASPFGGDFNYKNGDKPGGKPGYELGAALPKDMQDAAKALMQSVTVDKQDVQLKGFEPSSDVVTIENKMTGAVKLSATADGAALGFAVKLDKEELQPGEKTALRFSIAPKDRSPKPSGTVYVQVDPLGKTIPISVTFALAPETEKLLPDSVKKQGK